MKTESTTIDMYTTPGDHTNRVRPIANRTLILTVGAVAADVARQVAARLPISPGLAALTALVKADSPELDNLLAAQIASITTVEAAEAAAEAGLRLDRNHDLQLLLIVDAATEGSTAPQELVRTVGSQARRLLQSGIECRLLLLVSDPVSLRLPHALETLRRTSELFDHGIFLMSMTNTLGRRLQDTDALIARATSFVWGLLATPLAQALQHTHLEIEPATFTVVGITEWGFCRQEFRQACLRSCLRRILAGWRHDSGAAEAQAVAAHKWLSDHDADPDALTGRLAAAQPQHPAPSLLQWHAPAPWQLRLCFAPMLHDLVVPRPEQAAETVTSVATSLHAALATAVDHHLVDAADGAVATLAHWLSTLSNVIDLHAGHLADRSAGRQLIAAELTKRYTAEVDAIAASLANSPADSWRGWFGRLLRVWRWPATARTYLTLRRLGRDLTHTVRQQNQLATEITTFNNAVAIYTALLDAVQNWQDRVDELDLLLAALHDAVPETDLDDILLVDGRTQSIPRAAFDQLCVGVTAGTACDNRAAAAALGTLPAQLRQPDDAHFDRLHALVGNCVDAAPFSTLDVLVATLIPSAEMREQWWRQQLDRAAPLWRTTYTPLAETQRQSITQWQAVLTTNSSAFAEQIGNPTSLIWLDGLDNHLVLIRLEYNLPLEALITQP